MAGRGSRGVFVVLAALAVLATALTSAPPADAAEDSPSVLLVTVSAAGTTDDRKIKAALEDAGLTVEIAADEAVTVADAADKDVVLITTTVAPARIGALFTDVAVPVVNYEFQLHDDLGLVASGSGKKGETGSSRYIEITDPGHPIATAANVVGSAEVYTRSSRVTFGLPGPEAEVVASQVGRADRAVLFTYDAGSTMANGSPAPARRAGVFLSTASDRFLSSTGNALLVATLEWAMTPPGPPSNRPPAVDAGADVVTTTLDVPLAGQVSDDGLPVGATVASNWSGPAGVVFDDSAALTATATFPDYGSYELTLTANDSELTASDIVTVTITDPDQPTVLMVTVNAVGNTDDRKIKATLEAAGFAVEVAADEAVTADDANGKDAVLISSTAAASQVGSTFTDVTVPVVNYEFLLHDDLGLTATGSANRGEAGTFSTINIVDQDHMIASAVEVEGLVEVLTRRSRFTFGVPGPEAEVVATVSNRPDRAVLFTYDAGATLASGELAPARRAGLFPSASSDGFLNATGKDLLVATMQWATRIDQGPTAAGTIDKIVGQAPLTITADASTSSDAEGPIAEYLWDFGDGNEASEMIATHSYTTPGVYAITLTVTDSAGQIATTAVATITAVSAPPTIVSGNASFERAIIDNTLADADQIVSGDFDGDGDIDLFASSLTATGPLRGQPVYFNQQPTGSLVRTVLDPPLLDAYPVAAVDLDGDGDADMLSADTDGDVVAWLENNGSAGFTNRVVATGLANSALDGPRSVQALDIDGDSDLDLLVAAHDPASAPLGGSGSILWFENDGSQNWTSHVVDLLAAGATAARGFDAEGDGDLDIVVAHSLDNTVVWYQNDGAQNFAKQTIDSAAAGVAAIDIADLNGDGFADVVVAASAADSVVWYEGDGNGSFVKHVVDAAAAEVASVVADDLDRDGDVDIAAASPGDDTVAWFENDGSGTFARRMISSDVAGAQDIESADVDEDGDLDLFSVAGTNSEISVHTNVRLHEVAASQGQPLGIDTATMQTASAGVPPADLTYILTQAPIQGALQLAGSTLRAGQSFTQADVDADLVTYASSSEAWIDRFRFTVSEPERFGLGIAGGIFQILVTPVEPENPPDPIGPGLEPGVESNTEPSAEVDEYADHLQLIRSQAFRNRLHDASPWRDVPQQLLDTSDSSPLFGPRSDYLGSPNGNPEPSFPVSQGGQFRVACEFSHFAYDDPLVHPNQPGKAHLHMMFGNTDVNAYSTYETLRDSGSSTCNGQELNRSGYWAPAMIDGDGNARIPERAVVYYKAAGTGQGKTQAFLPQMTNIAPMPLSVPEVATFDGGETAEVNYKCSNNSSSYPFATGINQIPNCDGDYWFDTYGAPYPATRTVLEMEIKFWHCFDPTGAVDDWQQWKPSGPTRGSWFYGNCDGRGGQSTGAPPLDDKDFYPAVVYYLNYVVEAGEDTSDWFLSSDVDPATITTEPALLGQRGEMHHADWWGAWHPEINWEFLDGCVNYDRWPAESGCGFGYLSDGGPVGSTTPFSGRALRYRPQYDQVGDASTYKVPLATVFEELCEPLNPEHTYSNPASGALCIPNGVGGGEAEVVHHAAVTHDTAETDNSTFVEILAGRAILAAWSQNAGSQSTGSQNNESQNSGS
ncbi:MAG: FG-GAP-like repeat-containing protein [Acidimicrobiales bacterium]